MRVLFLKILKGFRKIERGVFRKLSGKGLGRIPGVSALVRLEVFLMYFIFEKLKPKGTVLINDVQGNKMYLNPNDRGITPMLLMDGVIEQYETEVFKKMVKKDMVVVDIGANIGYYSLIAAKLVGRNGIVYAFEPEPTTYELLCRNIEINNYANIIPVNKAVSNKQGKIEFWVDKAGVAISSFAKDNVLAFSKCPVDKLSQKPISLMVDEVTMDEFFKRLSYKVDLIKIDTQGAEGLILQGAEEILKSNRVMKITMEFWPEGLRKLGTDPLNLLLKMQKYGFKMKLINEDRQALELIEPIEFCRVIGQKSGHQEFNLLLKK